MCFVFVIIYEAVVLEKAQCVCVCVCVCVCDRESVYVLVLLIMSTHVYDDPHC